MSNVLKTVRPVIIILLKIKGAFSQDREGQTNMSTIVEVVEETDAEIFALWIFSCELLKNIYF